MNNFNLRSNIELTVVIVGIIVAFTMPLILMAAGGL